jgi:hypothetical protein
MVVPIAQTKDSALLATSCADMLQPTSISTSCPLIKIVTLVPVMAIAPSSLPAPCSQPENVPLL